MSAVLDKRVSYYRAIAHDKHFESAVERLSYMDAELRDIHTSLAILHRQRNFLVPALRPPPEILSRIFTYLVELEPHYYPDPADYDGFSSQALKPRLGWIKITQVCQGWRAIAFADSRLWSVATTSLGNEWLQEMLRLGKNVPKSLDVRAEEYGPIGESQLVLAARYLDKLETLQVMGRECHHLRTLDKTPSPALRTFRVHSFEMGTYLVSSRLFNREHGNLRELYVHNFLVDWSDPFPHNLTRITLTRSDMDYSIEVQDFRRFLQALRSTPELESLTVKRHFFHVGSVEAANFMDGTLTPIICPRLRLVDVYSTMECVFMLLSHLRPSPFVQLELATDSAYETEVRVFQVLQEMLRQHFAQTNTTLLSDMQTVEWRSYAPVTWQNRVAGSGIPAGPADPVFKKALVLSTWRDNVQNYLLRDYAGFGTAPTPHIRITIEYDEAHIVHPEDLIPMTAFPAARNISLQPHFRLSFRVFNHAWAELFASSQSLATLRVDRIAVEDLLSAHHAWIVQGNEGPFLPLSVTEIALLCVSKWGRANRTRPLDEWLVELWTNNRAQGVALSSILAGCIQKFADCVQDAEIKIYSVEHPTWISDDHEDWDEDAIY